jgi:hypothetical protein
VIPKSSNTWALTAYRYAVYGLIPLAGLVFGPIAIALGILGICNHRNYPEDHGIGHARAAIILGLLELLTNGLGLTFIAIGIASLMGS